VNDRVVMGVHSRRSEPLTIGRVCAAALIVAGLSQIKLSISVWE
jgi:hypothetical protein